ncbi:MAG: hypothetical protein MR364_01545 [Oscillospiraceae bacterium]|nr:hypothetical protein [Oscillospiraceae bacterium]
MHKLLFASDGIMTRHVKLENCETGKVELCFDDSDLRHDNQKDFWFMKIGCKYECKILLFGLAYDLSEVNEESCIICETIGWDLSIGNLKVLQVENNGNIYYVAINDVEELSDISRFIFRCSRKDLIQVNDVIYPSFL